MQRGDLLFLTNYEEEDIRVGEIVVFKIDGRDIPIVHRSQVFNSLRIAFTSCCRVLKLHEKEDGSIKFLTKVGVNDFLPLLSHSNINPRETTTVWTTGGSMRLGNSGSIERCLVLLPRHSLTIVQS